MKSIKPSSGEFESAKSTVKSVLEGCEPVLEKQEDYEVWLGYDGEPSAEAWGPQLIRVGFGDGETGRLEGLVASAYYRSWFAEAVEPEFQWQEMLRTGGGLHFAEQVTGWESDTDPSLQRREIPENALDSPVDQPGDFLRRHGYTASYMVVERLLRLHEIEDLPGLERSDVEAAVEELN